MILIDILTDGFFAAIAGIGFGAISHPPKRAFAYIAVLSALGHALRFCLMNYAGLDIATSSFIAGLVIGFGSLVFGTLIRCPMTVLYIPALLPMIPGMYAYKTIFALVMFMQHLRNSELMEKYIQEIFINSTVTVSVVFLLAVGATTPTFLLPWMAYSLTRKKEKS